MRTWRGRTRGCGVGGADTANWKTSADLGGMLICHRPITNHTGMFFQQSLTSRPGPWDMPRRLGRHIMDYFLSLLRLYRFLLSSLIELRFVLFAVTQPFQSCSVMCAQWLGGFKVLCRVGIDM